MNKAKLRFALVSLLMFAPAANAADVEWNDWSFDYSTQSNSSGLVLTNVKYKGDLILRKSSMPVMRVEYQNDVCGPYADILAPSRLKAAVTGAPNSACNNQAVCRRTFTQNGEQKFEIGANWQIGEYQIYQTYYFSENGYIDTRVYSRGLQCRIDHSHHAHWMFDFDIGDGANDRISRGDTDIQQTEFNDVRSQSPYWTIEDPVNGGKVKLIPSDDDGAPDNFSRWDAAGRTFKSAEVGRWRLGSRGEIGSNYMTPAETLDGSDLVMWYVSHLPHRAVEGSNVWHASGPRIEVVASEDPVTPPPPEPPVPPVPTPEGNNLLVNAGFESAQTLAGWENCADVSKTQVVSASREGSQALRIFGGGCIYQEVAVTAGESYSLSCDAQRNGSAWTILEFSFLDAGYNVLGTKNVKRISNSGDFATYDFSGIAPANTAFALTLAYSEDDTLVDACSLVEIDGDLPVDPPPVDPPAPALDSLLANGGFEDRLSNWNSCAAENLLSESSEADTGTNALAITGGGCIYQEFPVTPGTAYNMNCKAKRNSGNLYTSVSLAMLDNNYQSRDSQEVPVQSSAYADYTTSVTATSDSVYGTVVLYSEDPGVFDSCTVSAVQ